MWKGLSVLADTASPVVVVLSGSMEPAFQRGDLILLHNRDINGEPGVGDIVVYSVKGRDIPIVHRVVQKWDGSVSPLLVLVLVLLSHQRAALDLCSSTC